ncbi:MAG: phasin family protein [Bacteroidota bacterium]
MTTATKNFQKELKKTANDAISNAKTTAEEVQKDLTDAAGDVRDAVQKVFLAGLGALAVAEEEGSKVFKTLVSKGETIKLPGLGTERVNAVRKQLAAQADRAQDAVEDRVKVTRETANDVAGSAEDKIQDVVASVMKRLGVPTRDEISELTTSVERLSERVEQLKTERSAGVGPVLEAVGGGWYEIQVDGIVVEKVQGRDDAEAALLRIQEQRG